MGYLTRYDRFNPFREMSRMLDAMDSAMERSLLPSGFLADTADTNWLALDVSSDDKNVIVRTALPGVQEKDIDIKVSNDVLTISAEAKSEHEDKQQNWHVRELRYGKFSRSVQLPEGVSADKAEAALENGILTITLPRSQPGPVKQIAVKARKLLQGKN